MEKNSFFQSKTLGGAILGVVVFLMILLVFKAGVIVGVKKADFSCRWADNYHRNFGGPKAGFFLGFDDRDLFEANGTFGKIIKIDGASFVIQGPADMERLILTNETTVIKRLRETVKVSDLKIDDYVVVIGEPNAAGQIEAKLIRMLPPPPVSRPLDGQHFFYRNIIIQ